MNKKKKKAGAEQVSPYIVIIMMIMGLMGCSGDSREPEASEPQPTELQTPIVFSGQEGEELVTRAPEAYGLTRAGTPLHELSVSEFRVWGYKNMSYNEDTKAYGDLQLVFPGYVVDYASNSAATTTTNSSGWEYIMTTHADQTIKYWDWSAKAYRFFAVTGFTTHEAHEPNGAHEFTLAADATNVEEAPYYSRLWFSTGVLPTYADKQFGQPVQLEFLKPFARVRFMFTYSYEAEGVRLTETTFKPTSDYTEVEGDKVKIALKGTVTISYPLTGTATREWYSATPKADPTSGEVLEAFTEEYIPEGTEKWYTVLPCTSQGSYTLSVDVNGSTKTAVVPAELMSWAPGYSYTYIFKINELGGVEIEGMQAAVMKWSEMEGSHTVYNW